MTTNSDIPDEVIHRIAEAGGKLITRAAGKVELEVREIQTPLELREVSDGSPGIGGYASVFEFGYDVAGGPEKGGFTEIIEPVAFNRTLGATPDVRLLWEHGGMPLARSINAKGLPPTLALAVDESGLLVDTPSGLDMRNVHSAAAVSAIERGDVSEMSFGFRTPPGGSVWNHNYTERRIREASLHRGDVSIAAFGMNPATVVTGVSMKEQVQRSGIISVEFVRAYQRRASDVEQTFDDIRQVVRAAIMASLPESDDCYCYVDNLTAEWAVYEYDGAMYQVPYSLNADGSAELGEPTPVRVQTSYVPVEPTE